jgi:hypothetical protein
MNNPATILKYIRQDMVTKYSVQWVEGGYGWNDSRYSQKTIINLLNDLKKNPNVDPSTIQVFVVMHNGLKVHVYGNAE